MKQNQPVQKMFQKYFVWCIIVPIVLILSVALSVVFYLSQKEVDSRVELVQNQIVSSLELELYDSAMQMSYFLLINENEFLNNLGEYFSTEGIVKYAARDAMDQQYNQSIFLDYSIVGMQFFGSSGETLNYELENDIGIESIEELEAYTTAKDQSDRIVAEVLDAAEIFPNEDIADEKVIGLFMDISKYDRYDSIDMIMVTVTSNTFESITLASEWSNGVSIYLLDKTGEVLVKSDDLYVEEIETELGVAEVLVDSDAIEVVRVGKYGWQIATVANSAVMSSSYQYILLFVFTGIIIIFVLFYLYLMQSIRNIIIPINHLAHIMRKVKKKSVFEQVDSQGPEEIHLIGETYNEMILRIQELMEENVQKEREKQKEEIMALEYQINPHFLANTINSIHFMAKVAKFESIQKMAEAMNKILALSFRNKESVQTLQDELEILEAYVYIMKIRYANGFDVEFDVEDGCENYMVPKLMLQPFIENAIVHGFSGKDEQGEIKVIVTKDEKQLLFQIRDNGIGMDADEIAQVLNKEPENGSKIAVANINKRLKLYYGYDEILTFESVKGQYTIVDFAIPLEDNSKLEN